MSGHSVLLNPHYAGQVLDYSGLHFENQIVPTDVDAFIDFQNEAFVFIEAKHNKMGISTGQRLALERLVNACDKAGKHAVLFVASHNTDLPETVDVASCSVLRVYHKGEWKPYKGSVREGIEHFRAHVARGRANHMRPSYGS